MENIPTNQTENYSGNNNIISTNPKTNPLVVVSLILLILLLSAGSFVLGKYFTETKEEPVDTTVPIIKKPNTFPTTDPTADWKTYTNKDMIFKYPLEWSISGYVLSSSVPKINLVITPKDSTLMNECMQEISVESKNNVVIKKFTRVKTGTMCQTSDSTAREMWIIPSKDSFSPGISFAYSSIESVQAEEIFDQILSTFRFLDDEENNHVSTPTTVQLKQIPLISTEGWKTVSKDNISFKIPSDAKCFTTTTPPVEDEKNCTLVYTSGQIYIPSITVDMKEYKGGSRREEFFGDYYEDCHWLYEDAMFGNIKALQIIADGEWCQGGGGGIVTVVGDKLVVFKNLQYIGDKKVISRYSVKDTIISTLQEIK